MSIAVESIIRAAVREKDEPLNLILMNSSDRYGSHISKTGHNFYLIGKKWNHSLALFPENFKERMFLDYGINYDAIICLGRNRGYEDAKRISKNFHLPLLLAELDYPNPNIEIKKQSGDVNVFINELQAKSWGFNSDYHLIDNCVDSNLFTYQNTKRENIVLTAIQNWRERDWSHGFRLYYKYVKDVQTKTLGQDNFAHWQKLIKEYQTNLIYFNPTTLAPQPLQILEAMSCGAIVVAIDNEFSRELISNGLNGFLTKPEECSEKLKDIMSMSDFFLETIRESAKETLKYNMHDIETFTENWNNILNVVANKTFKGEIK